MQVKETYYETYYVRTAFDATVKETHYETYYASKRDLCK